MKQSWLGALLLGACASTAPTIAHVDADAILVLGHRPPLRNGTIEHELKARVDHGIALYRAGRAPLMVMAGGESTPGVIEADVMAAYAERAGVSSDAILRERASRNTIENARFSIALLHARVGRTPRVVLVTSDYHSERAATLVSCAGAEVEISPADPQLSAKERQRRLRSERWIRAYYGFIDECRRALGR